MPLRTIPIRRSGNRTSLFMGGDRELVMFTGLLAFALIFSAQELRASIVGISMWFISLWVFRLMAKSDPQMRHVYLRHRKYSDYYPARSTPHRINRKEFK
jgi:type IV secretory pathway TrbD component